VRFEALCALRTGRFLSALRFSVRDTYNFDALPNETSHPGCYGVGYISAEQESVTSAAMPHLTSANGGISRVNYKRLVTAAAELFDRLSGAWWIPALLMRLFVGYFFMETGWAKIHNLDAFTTRFAGWGIPYPAFNAALSAYTEFFGGALTMLGLGMRFVSIPMIINMIVAILTVKLKDVSGLDDFAELDEPLYALSFVWLFFSGAGWLSIDGLIRPVISSWLQQNKSKSLARAPIAESSLGEGPRLVKGHDNH
jgi:putative oxidoreductase